MASSEAKDPEKPEIDQPEQPQAPEEIIIQTGIPEQQALNTANIADPHNTAQSNQTDKPWSPKDTFKWMISILRCHNALASSHVRLQAEVNQLRQEIVEAAKHPIPPIWSPEGAEALTQIPKDSAFAQEIIAPLPPTPDWGTPSTPEPENVPSDLEDQQTAHQGTPPIETATEATPDKSPMPTQAQQAADAKLRKQLARHIPPNTARTPKQATTPPAQSASHTVKPSTSLTLAKARPAFPPAPPAPNSGSIPEGPQPKPKASSQSRTRRSPMQPPIKAKPPRRPSGQAEHPNPHQHTEQTKTTPRKQQPKQQAKPHHRNTHQARHPHHQHPRHKPLWQHTNDPNKRQHIKIQNLQHLRHEQNEPHRDRQPTVLKNMVQLTHQLWKMILMRKLKTHQHGTRKENEAQNDILTHIISNTRRQSRTYEPCIDDRQSVSQPYRTSKTEKDTAVIACRAYQHTIEIVYNIPLKSYTSARQWINQPLLGTVCVSQSVSKIHGQQIMSFPTRYHESPWLGIVK